MPRRIAYFLILIVMVGVVAALIFMDARAIIAFINASKSVNTDAQSNFTVLVLGEAGEGEGGPWEQAPNLTDAIILIRFLPKENSVDLVSIPRDLYGTFGTSTFKINEMLVRHELSQFMGKLPDITGIGTDKFVIVDLSIVKSVVDDLGGIDVDLPSTVTDSVSGYSISAGWHHLDGSDVDWLIRNRFAPEGDFFREDNQHIVIEAVLKKFLDLNLYERSKLLLSLTPQINKIETNVSLGQMYQLASESGNVTFHNAVLNFSTGLVESSSTPTSNGSQYILVPKDGMNNYSEIRDYITLQLQPVQPPQKNL